jgi:UDP-N-acetylglucosamine 2-epimerase (non-hydrolysing)
MPEEVNRVLTDHLSTLLFTTETSGNENLLREGIAERQVHFVGNCMVDSLLKHLEKAVAASAWRNFGLEPGGYALLTLHRPSNVDDSETLERVMTTMVRISRQLPILFPVHPRTAESMKSLQIELNSVILCDPMPYPTFVGLMAKAKCVLTDSGGVQEETTVLNIPCLTLRENTERPVTLTTGTNRLVGTDPVRIEGSFREILSDRWPVGRRPPLWDGKASQRIVDIIENSFHPLPRR